MIIYQCDGERYSPSKKCTKTFEAKTEIDKPWQWLTISGKIKNELMDRRVIQSHGTMHFCSRECLEFYLFKNNKADAIRQQYKLLMEAAQTIESLIYSTRQSDPINELLVISANTLKAIQDYKILYESRGPGAGTEE